MLTPRFPDVPLKAPHYESVYFTAAHPSDGTSFWVRHTVRKPPGQQPVGSLWFTGFTPDGPGAAKVNARATAPPDAVVAIGDLAWVTRDRAKGRISVEGLTASWDLRFSGNEAPFSHLPFPWLYSAPVPKTKSTSPRPDMLVSGTVTVDGHETGLEGWRGMLGHNWGSEHAHRWVWLRGAGFAEDPTAFLDLVIGRIKVGPVTVPWIANGLLSIGGERRRIGGFRHRADVRPRPDGLDLSVSGLTVNVQAPIARSVGWEYADPAGDTHQVRNCSNAGMALTVDGRTLTTTYGAVYELGTPETDPAVVMQPYPDR